MLNRVILQGRLGSDPELRRTQSGVEVATVTLAVDRDFKEKNGEKKTDWVTIVAWRNTATFLSKFFTKGRMAVVEGRLQIRDWTDKDGNKRRAAEVVADQVYFGDSKRDGDGEGHSATTTFDDGADRSASAGGFTELTEDDGPLPF